MNDLPNPLTPADCDLRNFREMPIDVPRLLGSDLVHDESPEACWSAMLLWCVSWHEVPAGSMPDNDEWLAKRAGYWHKGKLDPTWHDVRAGALHGWIKCADGRLYHPVLAEKVNAAWLSKHRHAHDKLGERIRKRNKARVEGGLAPLAVPEFEAWIDMGRPLERDLFPEEFSTPSVGNGLEFRRKKDPIPAEGGHAPAEAGGKNGRPAGRRQAGTSAEGHSNGKNCGSPGNPGISAGNTDSSGGNDGFSGGSDDDSAGVPSENALNRAERNRTEHVNTASGGGTAQAVARDDAPNAAAAFVEILRSSGVGFAADDARLASWPARGVTVDDLLTAIATGRKRRERERSEQPLNAGLLDLILGDVLAARAAKPATGARTVGDWWRSWTGIVEHGRTLGAEQGTDEQPFDFKLRVFNAAGDGPWWDDHNRAFRNTAGPVAAGALMGEGR
ncbi:YdaU family protein [Burkholderia vietnamiensis]|uniref:YdaU family protein n=1 Tax=Burkholderia vietnamiensis TaxID=60552 RepID=UPI001CF54FAA|nr:YdaU family protein [Burkholderia vietnamiensis]MCA8145451.1 YdaU family protein [Burkholderia vietnamiensis]